MHHVSFAKMDQVFSLKNQNFKNILEDGKKYWKIQGILSVQKSGNHNFKTMRKTAQKKLV